MTLFEFDFITFTLKDLVDVLLVGIIIYQILKLVKGTRGAQILVGLTLLLGVAVVAFWFQLEGLTWLFSTLAPFGLLVLVIVFQPELRSVLARMGQSRLLRSMVSVPQHAAREVGRAALRLSELKYGALIVIERRTGLTNFVESGKSMRAQLSSDLLVTLFTPYTPMHDGAVVVAGDSIVAAAVSLPLTTNLRYRKLHGMRHKAAVGVSEVSDAVVVVVSEETSAISIAHNGLLYHDIPRSEVPDRLAEFLRK